MAFLAIIPIAIGFWSTSRRQIPRSYPRVRSRPMAMSLATRTRYAACVSRSTMPSFFAWRGTNSLPDRMAASARGTPTRRGRRLLPPQPGRIPSRVSGSPMRVLGWSAATMTSQLSASS